MSSDAMILDSIGFMLEYSLTTKPACVLYRTDLNDNRVMKFSECGEEIYDVLYHAKDEGQIQDFLHMILKNEDPLHELRMLYLERNYKPPYQKSGALNIYDYILELIKK